MIRRDTHGRPSLIADLGAHLIRQGILTEAQLKKTEEVRIASVGPGSLFPLPLAQILLEFKWLTKDQLTKSLRFHSLLTFDGCSVTPEGYNRLPLVPEAEIEDVELRMALMILATAIKENAQAVQFLSENGRWIVRKKVADRWLHQESLPKLPLRNKYVEIRKSPDSGKEDAEIVLDEKIVSISKPIDSAGVESFEIRMSYPVS